MGDTTATGSETDTGTGAESVTRSSSEAGAEAVAESGPGNLRRKALRWRSLRAAPSRAETGTETGTGRSPITYHLSLYEHPVVPPHESHFRQVPLRTRVSAPHSGQGSPS